MAPSLHAIQRKLLKDIAQLKTLAGYLNAGFPNYSDLFGRDSLIAAWQMLPFDAAIAEHTLRTLAQYQAVRSDRLADADPGKILHEYRMDPARQEELPFWKWPYYGSVDATSWFIIIAGFYYRATSDRSLIESLWGHLRRAILWHIRVGDKDGDRCIEYKTRNPRGLFHQGWKDGFRDHLKITPPVAIVEEQGYFYRALEEFCYLAGILGKDAALARKLQRTAQQVARKCNEAFWMKDERFYALALDGAKHQRHAITSNPGHLLFTGILPRARQRAVVERLFKEDLFTSYGIRTLSELDPDFDPKSYHLGSIWPHDNWIIWYGLRKCGFVPEAQKIKSALLRAYHKLHSIPEAFGVVKDAKGLERPVRLYKVRQIKKKHLKSPGANPIQAWASAGLLNMIAAKRSKDLL